MIRRTGLRLFASAGLAVLMWSSGAASAASEPGAADLVAAAKLRAYCKACHAVGELRFIQSDDDAALWTSLFTERSTRSGTVWAAAISAVLSWPSDAPPPFDPIMDPSANRDWMPRGAKRLDFAADTVDGTPVRRLILERLSAASADGDGILP
jgi:hypothetical protein